MKTPDHRRRRLRRRAPRPRAARARPARRPAASSALVLADQVAPPPADLPRRPARRGAHRPAAGAVRGARATSASTACSTSPRRCRANARPTSTSACAPTSTPRAPCSTRCAPRRSRGKARRLVFSSSVAVFGPDPSVPLPTRGRDDTLPAPQTSYGTHKLICEHLVADYTRKGYIDGRAARLMTVTVRPGRPNGAASSFFSRHHPRAARRAARRSARSRPTVSHPVTSPARTVEGLIAVYEASREAFGGRARRSTCRRSTSASRDMLDALEEVAGPRSARARALRARRAHRRHRRQLAERRDRGARGARSGLQPDTSFADIIRQYIADCRAAAGRRAALKGLAKERS